MSDCSIHGWTQKKKNQQEADVKSAKSWRVFPKYPNVEGVFPHNATCQYWTYMSAADYSYFTSQVTKVTFDICTSPLKIYLKICLKNMSK